MSCNCVNGIEDIREGTCNAQRGLNCLCQALEALRCCQLCEAENSLNQAACLLQKSLCQLEEGLCQAEGDLSCQEVRDIREGICCIRKGLDATCEALNCLRCRNTCAAIECANQAACLTKNGICKLQIF